MVFAHLDGKGSLDHGQVCGLIRLTCRQEMLLGGPKVTLQLGKQLLVEMMLEAKQLAKLNEGYVQKLATVMPRTQVNPLAVVGLGFLVEADLLEQVLWEANEVGLHQVQTLCETRCVNQTNSVLSRLVT